MRVNFQQKVDVARTLELISGACKSLWLKVAPELVTYREAGGIHALRLMTAVYTRKGGGSS